MKPWIEVVFPGLPSYGENEDRGQKKQLGLKGQKPGRSWREEMGGSQMLPGRFRMASMEPERLYGREI